MESIKIVGNFTLSVINGGRRMVKVEKRNMVVDSGLESLSKMFINDPSKVKFEFIAVGNGPNPPAPGDTALSAEISRKHAALTYSGATVNAIVTWPVGDISGDVLEAGMFNISAGGTLFNRIVFPKVTVGATDALQVSWDITFKRA